MGRIKEVTDSPHLYFSTPAMSSNRLFETMPPHNLVALDNTFFYTFICEVCAELIR